MTNERLLRLDEVKSKTGLGRSTIYRRISEGRFPGGYSLGEGCVRWKESEINEWIGRLPSSGEAEREAPRQAGART